MFQLTLPTCHPARRLAFALPHLLPFSFVSLLPGVVARLPAQVSLLTLTCPPAAVCPACGPRLRPVLGAHTGGPGGRHGSTGGGGVRGLPAAGGCIERKERAGEGLTTGVLGDALVSWCLCPGWVVHAPLGAAERAGVVSRPVP